MDFYSKFGPLVKTDPSPPPISGGECRCPLATPPLCISFPLIKIKLRGRCLEDIWPSHEPRGRINKSGAWTGFSSWSVVSPEALPHGYPPPPHTHPLYSILRNQPHKYIPVESLCPTKFSRKPPWTRTGSELRKMKIGNRTCRVPLGGQ